MPPTSSTAHALARRLLARAGAPGAPGGERPEAAAAGASLVVAEQVFRELAAELSRWFGLYGFHALLTRALTQERAGHPALAAVRVNSAGEPHLDGVADAVRVHGDDAVTDGVAAVLAALIDLLGRLIGEDMAVNLVSQAALFDSPDAGPDAGPDTRRDADVEAAP